MVPIGVVIRHEEEMSLIVCTRSNCFGYCSALDFKIPSSTCEIKSFRGGRYIFYIYTAGIVLNNNILVPLALGIKSKPQSIVSKQCNIFIIASIIIIAIAIAVGIKIFLWRESML